MNSLAEVTMRKDIQKTDGISATVAAMTGKEPSTVHLKVNVINPRCLTFSNLHIVPHHHEMPQPTTHEV